VSFKFEIPRLLRYLNNGFPKFALRTIACEHNASSHDTHRSVCVRPGVGHRQGSGTAVFEIEVLVLKCATVDGLSTGPVAVREVSPLAHETGDDAVKSGPLEALSLSLQAQLFEVFDRLGNRRAVQAHFDAAGIASVDVNVEKHRLGDFGIGGSSA
jgi:hypothetical protein